MNFFNYGQNHKNLSPKKAKMDIHFANKQINKKKPSYLSQVEQNGARIW